MTIIRCLEFSRLRFISERTGETLLEISCGESGEVSVTPAATEHWSAEIMGRYVFLRGSLVDARGTVLVFGSGSQQFLAPLRVEVTPITA